MADQNWMQMLGGALGGLGGDISRGAGYLTDVGRSAITGSDPQYTYMGQTPQQSVEQSTIDMLQRELPSLLNGADMPQFTNHGGFINGLVKVLDDMSFGSASALTGVEPTGFYVDTPKSDVISQAVKQLLESKAIEAKSKGAVAARGGAQNAGPNAATGEASLADMLAAQLANRSQAREVYSAVGNDISYINKDAAGTQVDPSYGNMSPANLLPQQDPRVQRQTERDRIMQNLFGVPIGPIPRPNPTYSEDDYINALRQRQLQQMYQEQAVPQGRGQQPYLPPQLQQALELAAWRQRGGN